MRVITAAELINKTNFELTALYAEVRQELENVRPGSYREEILLISLENIRQAFASPRIKPPKM